MANHNQFPNIVESFDWADPPLSPKEIRDLAARSRVLVLRTGRFDLERFIGLMQCLGEPVHHVLEQFAVPGHREVIKISNLYVNGVPIGVHEGGSYWHTDMSYKEDNTVFTSLHCANIISAGGYTEFVDCVEGLRMLRAARASGLLSSSLDYVDIDSASVLHRFGNRAKSKDSSARSQKLTERQESALNHSVRHPLVITHPLTNAKSLYGIAGTSFMLIDHEAEASRDILDQLADFVVQHAPRYVHRYKIGDIVIWDNVGTLHRGPYTDISTDAAECRLLYRMNINYGKAMPTGKRLMANAAH